MVSLLVLYILWVCTNVWHMSILMISYVHFHCPKCPLYFACSSPHLTSPPLSATTDLFIASVILPFVKYHRVGILRYIAFSDWLLLLSNMHLRFLHVFSWFNSSFFFFNILFIFERERELVSKGGTEREREGDTEHEAGSRLWAVSTKPSAGLELTDHQIMTWVEVRCLTDWATQALQKDSFFFFF